MLGQQFDGLLLRGRVQDSGEHRVGATLCLTIAYRIGSALDPAFGNPSRANHRELSSMGAFTRIMQNSRIENAEDGPWVSTST